MGPVVRAIVKRELRSWLGNPAGYVFICVFAFACAACLLRDVFFTRNVASLDTLSEWFPYLLVFLVPAITMGIWAGERGNGTDELLLTLPARESQIVLGKYLGAICIYSIVLLFTLPLVAIVGLLGAPDWLTVLSTYIAWWLFGTVMVGAGMVASLLSDNLTVGFILGALFCAALVGVEAIAGQLSESLTGSVASFLPVAQFHHMAGGLLTLSGVLMMAGLAAAFYYANLALVLRRHFRRGEGAHRWVRFASIAVAAVALGVAAGFWGPRADLTSGRVHSLSAESRNLVEAIERPVMIEAFVPPLNKVPRDYVQTRRDLLNILREFASAGRDRIVVRVVEAERYSEEARVAKEKFGIEARPVLVEDDSGSRQEFIFMGVACTSGPEQIVIPFLYNKLPVEYELARSVRTVALPKRKRLGVLQTDVDIMGGFDTSTFRPRDPWLVVEDLKLQYDVATVNPDSDYPEDLDVLLAPMASSLTQPQIDRLEKYILEGNPVLLLDDPHPFSAPGTGPGDPKGGPRNPMMMMQQPPREEKGDFAGMLRSLGVRWNTTQVAWDVYNPHPEFSGLPRTYVFVGANSGTPGAFNPNDDVTEGLQEVVMLDAGVVESAETPGVVYQPLLLTSPVSGTADLHNLYIRDFFGISPNPKPRLATHPARSLACRVKKAPSGDDKGFHVIFVADLDFISNEIFQIRRLRRPGRAVGSDFNFDNATFALNAIDSLAGDRSFIALRKRRPDHRTLTRIERESKTFQEAYLRRRDEAEEEAAKALDEVKSRFDDAVKAVRESADLDEMAKAIKIQSIENVEQRRLDVAKIRIDDKRDRLIEEAAGERNRNIRSIKDFYKRLGWLMSPVLGMILGIAVFAMRTRRERENIPAERQKKEASS